MINEAKRKELGEEAKQILKKFSKTLESVKFKENGVKKNAGGFREEGTGAKSDNDFRAMMFANAPNKTEDCIVAEKKSW